MSKDKTIYQVAILRKDNAHIMVRETSNFEECLATWKALHTKWADSVKEPKPFVLEDPIITAFEPGLIYEITLKPLYEESTVDSSNPYQKAMVERGLSNSLQGTDLLGQRPRTF